VPPEFVKVGSSSGAGRPPAKRKAAGGGKAAADKGAGRANGVGGSSAAGQKRKLSKVDEADWLESRFSPLAAESSKLARGVADAFAELPPEEQARLLPLLPECDRDPAALQRAMRSEQFEQAFVNWRARAPPSRQRRGCARPHVCHPPQTRAGSSSWLLASTTRRARRWCGRVARPPSARPSVRRISAVRGCARRCPARRLSVAREGCSPPLPPLLLPAPLSTCRSPSG